MKAVGIRDLHPCAHPHNRMTPRNQSETLLEHVIKHHSPVCWPMAFQWTFFQ